MEILNTIKDVLEEINGCQEIYLEDELKIDLGLDSLSMVSLIVGLESKLNITFDDSDLDPSALITVGDLVNLVRKTL